MPAETFFVFLVGVLLLNITPGPDMAFTLASAVKGGIRAGVAAAIGVGAGSLAWAAATAAGLAALLAASQHGLMVVRIAGGCYLLYLAVVTYRHRRDPIEGTGAPEPGAPETGAKEAVAALRAGFFTNLLNPKVGLFYIAFLPAFTDAALGPVWVQALTLGAVFSLCGALVLVAVAALAGAVRRRLVASARLRARVRTLSAAVFGGLGLHLIFARTG